MSTTRPHSRPTARHRRGPLAVLLLGLLAVTAGCGDADDASTTAQAEGITVTDPWVKAADSGMTGVFAVLTNTTDQEIHVVGVSSDVSARGELHETAAADGGTVMREKEGGLLLAAGAEHELVPGGDHLMLMGLTAPVLPGAEVEVTLTAQDGSSTTFTAQARSFAGGQEEYEPSTQDDAATDGDT